MGRVSDKVRVSITFREELAGDTAETDSFYIKVTPRVKITPIITAETLQREAVRAIQTAVRARRKK